MFLIIGTAPVRKIGKTVIRRNCPRCSDIRNFQEVSVRQFLSFFFIPLIPISKPTSIYVCPTCKFGMSAEDATSNIVAESVLRPAVAAAVPDERAVVFCTRCDGPMNVPLSERRQNVTCPHCSMEFTVKGAKGPIPDAVIQSEDTPDSDVSGDALSLTPSPETTP